MCILWIISYIKMTVATYYYSHCYFSIIAHNKPLLSAAYDAYLDVPSLLVIGCFYVLNMQSVAYWADCCAARCRASIKTQIKHWFISVRSRLSLSASQSRFYANVFRLTALLHPCGVCLLRWSFHLGLNYLTFPQWAWRRCQHRPNVQRVK